ncbi:MAG TPA: hypothetical protein VF457_04645, partial [Burkholderiaceae bacterium]
MSAPGWGPLAGPAPDGGVIRPAKPARLMRPRRAVFLESEGVLFEAGEAAPVMRPEDVVWCPGAVAALRALRDGGWGLVLASNQPAIARGLIGPAAHDNLVGWMRAELAHQGVTLDGAYHCPHLPDAPLAAWHC